MSSQSNGTSAASTFAQPTDSAALSGTAAGTQIPMNYDGLNTYGFQQTSSPNNLLAAQQALGAGTAMARMGTPTTGSSQQRMTGGRSPQLQAVQFQPAVGGSPLVGGTSGGSALLQLMQQLKS